MIKTLKAYVCFYLFRKSIMLGFLTFVRTTAKMHNEKGSGIFFFFPIILESVFTLKDQ